MESFVDNLFEDEAERIKLQAKPTCFIVVGKPGVGKSTLAKEIAKSWKCILIDDTELLKTHVKNKTNDGIELLKILSEEQTIPEDKMLKLILERLNSQDVGHYGYVLSCLPFVSKESLKVQEQIELIKNLEFKPDFVINIKCADNDLLQRLSGVKQQLGKDHDGRQDNEDKFFNQEKMEDKEEDKEEMSSEHEVQEDIIEHMVFPLENMTEDALTRINIYNEKVLRPLEDYMAEHNPLYLLELDGNNTPEELHTTVMSRLGSMALKHVSIPLLLHHSDDEDIPEDIDTEHLLRHFSSAKVVAPGFRWRRSRWGQNCPVALKEGRVIPGNPKFSVGFEDKLYILSSQEALQKFVTNPRLYLLPPMPRPPCRVAIVGPPLAGVSTVCKLLAQHYKASVLDIEEMVRPVLAATEKERLNKITEESTQAAIKKIQMKSEKDETQNPVTEDHPEVKAMVLSAIEEARKLSPSPLGLYADALRKRVKEIEDADNDEEFKTGWVLDGFPKNTSQMEALLQGEILPDIIFCLKDSDGNHILRRMYEMNKEAVNEAIMKRMLKEQLEKERQCLDGEEQSSEVLSNLETDNEETDGQPLDSRNPSDPDISEILVPKAVTQPDQWELGFPPCPEMDEFKLQMQQFMSEWEQMLPNITVTFSELDIGGKHAKELLHEMVLQMEKPFEYLPWELTAVDLEEEAEDFEALVELEGEEERSRRDNGTAEKHEYEGHTTPKRLLGDTLHFCPVAFKTHNILRPCSDQIAARYREKTFYFFSTEARDAFLQDPLQFTTRTELLKPPAPRVLLIGTRGSGKTLHGRWLAQQLGLFHIQFREHLQMLILAKTKSKVPNADEVDTSDELSKHLDAKIKEAMEEDGKEMEEAAANMDDSEEVELNDVEMAIKAYLSDGVPLTPQILDMVVASFWKQEPYMSTGFILEGFPHLPNEVQYMLQQQLYPDIAVIMSVDVTEVQKRLLPAYLEKWRERRKHRKEQLSLLQELRREKREKNIAIRRAELIAEKGDASTKLRHSDNEDDHEEEAVVENIEEEIEAMLEEEFALKEEDEETENEETEEAATERLEMEIEERFVSDENNLTTVTELLNELNLSSVSINASRKPKSVQHQLLRNLQHLLTDRESLFQMCQPISVSLAEKLLLSSYKHYSALGCWDPIKKYKERSLIQPLLWPPNNTYPLIFNQYIYFFASKENRKTFMLNPLKYLRQPKPMQPLPLKLAVIGPPKSGKTTVAQMFAQQYGLQKLSVDSVTHTVLETQGHTDLAAQVKKHVSQGHVVPDQLTIQCLEVALLSSVCSTQGYVLDGFPVTLVQAQLMGSRSIIPMIVIELDLDTVEVLRRGHMDKIKLNKSEVMDENTDILHVRTSAYKKEVDQVKKHFQQQNQNWKVLDGSKSKWCIWNSVLKEVSVSMTYINTYLEKVYNGQAACINRLCITPQELHSRLGEFGQYCPVCLALHRHLLDGSETEALTHTAQYVGQYYKMCGQEHLNAFLSTPDQFVPPNCPHSLPPANLLPRKLTEIQVKDKFPQHVELKGFCPVTYQNGKQRYEALVQGKIDYAVEYKERIYIFHTKQKQDMFLRSPETYCNQSLPTKVPPLCEPTTLTSLPTLGYLEQGVAVAVIKAMTAAGCLKPKFPFLSIKQSALTYVALYLKAFNQKSPDYTREMYKKKLALFEENCALIPYLTATMRHNYKPPSERPIDFEFKLHRFLALDDQQKASLAL